VYLSVKFSKFFFFLDGIYHLAILDHKKPASLLGS